MSEIAEHGHGHGHGHDPAISKAWKYATVAGNAVIGAAELVTGAGTTGALTLAVVGDGLHNAGDAVTYWAQTNDVLSSAAGSNIETTRRRIIFSVIAASSLYVAVQGGVDLATHHEDMGKNDVALAAAAASVALNGTLYAHLYAGMRRTRTARSGEHCQRENDLHKHMAVDTFSAVAGLAGAVGQRYNFDIFSLDTDSVAAVAGGLVGAWAFRPTKKNLTHTH